MSFSRGGQTTVAEVPGGEAFYESENILEHIVPVFKVVDTNTDRVRPEVAAHMQKERKNDLVTVIYVVFPPLYDIGSRFSLADCIEDHLLRHGGMDCVW